MELNEIEQHWRNWALEYKSDLRATTKTPTLKQLEISALFNAIKRVHGEVPAGLNLLEVGCGNGHNCFGLKPLLPSCQFTGVDFITEMVENAKMLAEQEALHRDIVFWQGNILELSTHAKLKADYDIIYTDRCLINLNSIELQQQALDQLGTQLAPGGHIVLIENTIQTYTKQNRLRRSVGLQERTPDKFNCFIDEAAFLAHADKNFELLFQDDFISLHDLILYVLVPMTNGGKVEYDHPLVHAATKLLLSTPQFQPTPFGDFGQNRLYCFKKRS